MSTVGMWQRERNLVSLIEELSIGGLDICIACHASGVSNE